MTIEKKKNGSYLIKQMVDGKYVYVTVDHKPSKKEAGILIADAIQNHKENKPKEYTFKYYAEKYIEIKEPILSVSTIRGYNVYLRNMPDKLKKTTIDKIDNILLQEMVAEMLKDHKRKYVKNIMGFVGSVLALYRPDFKYTIIYPSVTEEDVVEPYIPSSEEVQQIFEMAKGTMFEIPIALCASCGLRRSEVCALTIDDLDDDNFLTINKGYLQDTYGEWVIKPPKTKKSIRRVYVDDALADAIRKQGYIFNGYPNSIYDWLANAEKKLGIQHFSLHKLRHYYCSELSAVCDEATVLKLGGWSDSSVMKRVYRHSRADDEAMKQASKVTALKIK